MTHDFFSSRILQIDQIDHELKSDQSPVSLNLVDLLVKPPEQGQPAAQSEVTSTKLGLPKTLPVRSVTEPYSWDWVKHRTSVLNNSDNKPVSIFDQLREEREPPEWPVMIGGCFPHLAVLKANIAELPKNHKP